MFQTKLGNEKAKMVLRAFAKDPQHFGFIKVKEEELAKLSSIYSPSGMPLHQDVYTFRAGAWMVMIVSHKDYVDVTLMNPYNVSKRFPVAAD